MVKQYWVGEFFVDLSRNQISLAGESQTLAPKALSVLTCLAENQGSVVSYDELLNRVWPSSVVTPNTLQRSIAQLRKAFGESSKAQGLIKTHSKQGYSLECQVTWSEQQPADAANKSAEPKEKPAKRKFLSNALVSATLVVLVSLSIALLYSLHIKSALSFSELRYITATDDKEYGASYSPNGEYIVFHRYYDHRCINNIFAKNAQTLEEHQLTAEMGTYSGRSISPDGNNLVFIKESDCTKPVSQLSCYSLMRLNFRKALKQAQKADELLQCQSSAIKNAVWVDNEHIAMLQRVEQNWRLIVFSLTENITTTLYQLSNGNISSFSYLPERNRFVLSAIKNDGQQTIEILSKEGELISSKTLRFPEGSPQHPKVSPQVIPNSDKFIFSAFGQLYTVTEQGEVRKVTFPFDTSVGAPAFHPNGQKLLLIKGRYDSDVATLAMLPLAPGANFSAKNTKFSVFERSIESEYHAKYQPKGNAIAFASERTGTEQVWLFDQGVSKEVTKFNKGTHIQNLHWSSDGKSILVLANRSLHQVFLNGDSNPIRFRYPIANLYYWDSDKQEAIASIIENGSSKFAKISLDSMKYQLISNKGVKWASKSDSGSLIFLDYHGKLWKKGVIENQLIEPLTGQGSSKRFVLKGEVIYGLNKTNQLWRYNLKSNEFKILSNVKQPITFISDIKNNELLVTFVVAAKKEVIELSVAP